jgi:hypothetical protein
MPTTVTPLTTTEREMLEFSPLVFEFAGVREAEIRRRFGMSAASFSLALLRLMDRPEAEACNPVEVHRLRRLRDARQRSRSVRR